MRISVDVCDCLQGQEQPNIRTNAFICATAQRLKHIKGLSVQGQEHPTSRTNACSRITTQRLKAQHGAQVRVAPLQIY
jgi:hypothetical protein